MPPCAECHFGSRRREPFLNSLEMNDEAASLNTALHRQPVVTLDDIAQQQLEGAGIYAIYYTGSFPAYRLIAKQNSAGRWAWPIYVGNAEPRGDRGRVAGALTPSLNDRLVDHRTSIECAENLQIADFSARWLILEPLWVTLGESVLINRFSPVWNTLIDGFALKGAESPGDPGERSRWDTIHPGRTAVKALQARPETPEAIQDDVEEYLRVRIEA